MYKVEITIKKVSGSDTTIYRVKNIGLATEIIEKYLNTFYKSCSIKIEKW